MRCKVQAMASEAHEFDALSAIAANEARQIAAGKYTGAPAACIEARQPEIRASQYFEPEQALAAQAAALDPLEACGAIVTPSATASAPKDFVTAGDSVFCPIWTCPSRPRSQSAAAQRQRPAPHVQLVGRAFSEGRRFKMRQRSCRKRPPPLIEPFPNLLKTGTELKLSQNPAIVTTNSW